MLALALRAVLSACKDLENSTTFLCRNLHSAFEAGALRDELHEHQAWAVRMFDEAVGRLRDKRIAKSDGGLAAALDAASLSGALSGEVGEMEASRRAAARAAMAKLPGRLGEGGDGFGPGLAANVSVLDEAYRRLASRQGDLLQKRLPAALATGCREQVQERFAGWTRALAAWRRDPSLFSGRPEMPGYHDKRGLAVGRIQAAALGKRLPSLDGKALFEDAEGKLPLRPEALAAWAGFDLEAALGALRKRLGREPAAGRKSKGRRRERARLVGRFVQLRLVPEAADVRLEAVFECVAEIPDGVALAEFAAPGLREVAAKAAARRDGKKLRGDGTAKFMAFEPSNDEALAFVRSYGADRLSATAGLDLGMTNVAALAYGSGRPASVISGMAFDSALARLDDRLDEALGRKCSPALRALRGRRDAAQAAGVPPAKDLLRRLGSMEAEVARDPEIVGLRLQRRNLRKDLTHRLASGIVDLLKEHGVQTLVAGKNDLWKTGCDMGKTQNRRFHRIAHAELLAMLRWKCLEAGILMATCEESWTSRVSFAADEPFPAAPKGGRNAPAPAARAPSAKTPFDKPKQVRAPAAGSDAASPGDPRRKLVGSRRRDPKSRSARPAENLFETPGKGRWSRIHADANGSYNIVRKACPNFAPHPKLSSAFELLWLSPRGLRPFKAPSRPKIQRI